MDLSKKNWLRDYEVDPFTYCSGQDIKHLVKWHIFVLFLHAGPDSFYVTNDNFFHFDKPVLCYLYRFLLHNWLHANIVYFDGFKATEAIGGVDPNGITMDKDKRFAYVD